MFEFFSNKKYYNEEENKILEHYNNPGKFTPEAKKAALILNIVCVVGNTVFIIILGILFRSQLMCGYIFPFLYN